MEKKRASGELLLMLSLVAAAAAQCMFGFHYAPFIWMALFFLAANFALIYTSNSYTPDGKAPESLKFTVIEGILFALIIVLAVFLRLYKSGEIPPGIWFDEAQNGNEVIRILNGIRFEVFIPRATQMPAMYFDIAAFFTRIFGVNVGALRDVSVFAGTLSIAAFYFLCRHIFGDRAVALSGAFLLATSRWHMTFSRLAFLGMLTLLLMIICFYFYLKAVSRGNRGFAVVSGVSMGLALYTFSAANFIPIIIVFHMLSLPFAPKDIYLKKRIIAGMTTLVVAAIIALPLILYAVNDYAAFSQRMNNLTITNETQKAHSVTPLLDSVKKHLLMFNFEGDNNGRHNISGKPMLDVVTGALFAAGFLAALAGRGNVFYFLWFFIMLCAGIMTVSTEAPQAYRTIGIVPVIYVFVLYILKKIGDNIYHVNKTSKIFIVFLCVLLSSAASVNIYQYFIVYPKASSTYLSFSPEATAMAQFIRGNSGDYLIYVSPANRMFGFFPWEQKAMCDFVNYGGPVFEYMNGYNGPDETKMKGKKGVIIILRPSDADIITAVDKEYPGASCEKFPNRITGEIMFECYYIGKGRLKMNRAVLDIRPVNPYPGKQD
jgi:4-amino-4-deoxy-L-arabinose transferase-like glycosyltransferase